MEDTTNRSVSRFEELLSIKIEPLMQDWDIELADANCVEDFCDIYERESWADLEKQEVMRPILASFDDRLRKGKPSKALWKTISNLLKRDYDLHKEVVEYWSLLDEKDSNNVYAATPFVREIWQSRNSNQI